MKRNLAGLFLILATAGFILTGCGTSDSATVKSKFPATDEGATNLLKEFVKPGADLAALSKQLRPTKADYEAIFKPDFAVKAASVYDPAWEAGQMVITLGNPARTEVKIYPSTTDEVISWTGTAAKDLAGGWKQLAPHLKPGVKIYRFDFVEPGQTEGMHYEGLVNINGNWRIFPKPWRLVN